MNASSGCVNSVNVAETNDSVNINNHNNLNSVNVNAVNEIISNLNHSSDLVNNCTLNCMFV